MKKTGVLLPTRSQLPLLGVELQSEAAYITFRIGGAPLAGNGREAQQALGGLSNCGEHLRFAVFRNVVGDRKRSVSCRALGVNDALRDALAVEVRVFLEELPVLDKKRSHLARGQAVLVVGDWYASRCGQLWSL